MPPPEMFGGSVATSVSARCNSCKLAFRQQRIAGAEADLRQPRAGAHDDRKGARADFEIERAVVAGRDLVELVAVVGHDAGEDVEPAGRALRVGRGGNRLPAAPGSRAAARYRRSPSPAPRHRRDRFRAASAGRVFRRPVCRAGQEAGAHPPGLVAEPEVEARRLDLVGVERRAADAARPTSNSAAISLIRKNCPVCRASRVLLQFLSAGGLMMAPD